MLNTLFPLLMRIYFLLQKLTHLNIHQQQLYLNLNALSRTLIARELKHSFVEKEAYTIVEALRKWHHFLIGQHFKLITDQKSVALMIDTRHYNKIKNEKILRWRSELACQSYGIIYIPGKQNYDVDTLSRVCSLSSYINKLYDLHSQLSHPGITRMVHQTRSRNLSYSVEEIKKVITAYPICTYIKSQFYKKQKYPR